MFENLISNKNVLNFIQNEIKINRNSGTYLFYGSDRDTLKEIAKYFAKSLNCISSNDNNEFCGTCESCIRIEKETHGDLEILDDISGIKIDDIRELQYKESTSSYEGRKKIYIIRDIEKLRKESSNALLKMIEEPKDGSFFLLLSNTLHVLPTIKSRSILVHIPRETFEDLGITLEEYNFFLGNAKEIHEYKLLENNNLKDVSSYENIGEHIKNWLSTNEFSCKINIYKSIRDFLNLKDYLNTIEKINFAEKILVSSSDFGGKENRIVIREILSYTLSTVGNKINNLEKLLEIKKMSSSNINLKTLLIIFYTTI